MNILNEIIQNTKLKVEHLKKNFPLDKLKQGLSPLKEKRFQKIFSKTDMAFICEVKKASPSKGIIRDDFDPLLIAEIYQENNASAISVLTEEKYFLGSLAYLKDISLKVNIPLIRKDFIIDEYQIYEALTCGASAILLIASALETDELCELFDTADSLNLDVLMEIHNEDELNKALKTNAKIIGINNRDLKSFKTDLAATERLSKLIPSDKWIVSESGINSAKDIKRVYNAGARGVLIGEALCRENDIGNKLRQIMDWNS